MHNNAALSDFPFHLRIDGIASQLEALDGRRALVERTEQSTAQALPALLTGIIIPTRGGSLLCDLLSYNVGSLNELFLLGIHNV